MRNSLLVWLLVALVGIFSTSLPTFGAEATDAVNCTQYNGDCDSCVSKSSAKCIYCSDVKECRATLSKGAFGVGDVCSSLFKASWETCSVNLMALVIAGSVVGGLLIISLCACICCCCCCKNSAKEKLKWMRQDAAAERRSEERKAKYAERRAERQAKNDEIRKKYGLFKDGQGGYVKMEDTP